MRTIQEIWDSIEEAKKEQREIRSVYKDMLNSTGEYEDLLDELQKLKTRKKQMETAVASQMEDKMRRFDLLKHEVAEAKQTLADLSLTTLMRGEKVEVSGPNDTAYDPLFSVRFQKRS